MRKISFWILIFALAAGTARAQDAATQQQIDKLTGQLQDIIAAQDAQRKQLDNMEKEISDLRDKLNAPVVNDSASTGDLKKLAAQVREIDQKRLDDRELILRKIEDLGKIAAATASTPPPRIHHPAPPKDPTPEPTTQETTQQNCFEYKVQAGNSLSGIIKAYRDKGVKVTLSQVLKANPGMKADSPLYVGKTIYIPDTSAK